MEVDWVLERFKEWRGFLFFNLICNFCMFFFSFFILLFLSFFLVFLDFHLEMIFFFFFFLFFCISSIIHWIVPLRRHFSFGIFYLLLAMGV